MCYIKIELNISNKLSELQFFFLNSNASIGQGEVTFNKNTQLHKIRVNVHIHTLA